DRSLLSLYQRHPGSAPDFAEWTPVCYGISGNNPHRKGMIMRNLFVVSAVFCSVLAGCANPDMDSRYNQNSGMTGAVTPASTNPNAPEPLGPVGVGRSAP
ncbi:MAG: hypothetical protein ACM3SV_07495, partial [Betaproteobacteria bacterium]